MRWRKLADLILIAILIICAVALIAPAALIIFGLIKRKKKLTVKWSVLAAAEILIIAEYYLLSPTRFNYLDSYTLGKSREEIIAVYGEPEYKSKYRYGYFVRKDNGFFGIMDSNLGVYYYIHFDKNGVAESVSEGGPIGG